LNALEESVAGSFLADGETYVGVSTPAPQAPIQPVAVRQVSIPTPYSLPVPTGGSSALPKSIEMYDKPKSVSAEQIALQAKLREEAEKRRKFLELPEREQRMEARRAEFDRAREAMKRTKMFSKEGEDARKAANLAWDRMYDEQEEIRRIDDMEKIEREVAARELDAAQREAFSQIFSPKEQQKELQERLSQSYETALAVDPKLAAAYEEKGYREPQGVPIFETKLEPSSGSSTRWMMLAPTGTSMRRVPLSKIPDEIKRQENIVAFRRGLMQQYADSRQVHLRHGRMEHATSAEERFNVNNTLYQEALKNLNTLRLAPEPMTVPIWSGGAK
jgi:hypothetical protein